MFSSGTKRTIQISKGMFLVDLSTHINHVTIDILLLEKDYDRNKNRYTIAHASRTPPKFPHT